MNPEEQTGSSGQVENVTCDGCGAEFPKASVGKLSATGKPLCIPCSLKVTSATATTTSKEEREQHEERVEASMEKLEKEKGSRRLVMALLLIALPVIAIEVFLLIKHQPQELTAVAAAENELMEYMVVSTVLGQYYDDRGEYPPQLTGLVPEYWSSDEAGELEYYQYVRVSSDSYRLQKTGSLLPAPLISQAVSQDLMPVSMTSSTDLDGYFDRIDDAK